MTYEANLEKERAKYESVQSSIREIIGEVNLPNLGETRAETAVPEDLSEEKIEQLYEVMARLGFGRESNISPEEAGMQNGYLAVIEAGKPNKVLAELSTIADSSVEHGPVVFTATSERKIGQDEVEFLQNRGIRTDNIETEMQMVMALVASLENVDSRVPQQVAFGYDVMSRQTAKDEYSGQAIMLGFINEQPIYALSVDRAYTEDGSGKYTQPSTADMLVYAIEMVGNDNVEVGQAAIVTGGLYGPTRAIDAIVANKRLADAASPVVAGMVAYGRDTMATVTGKPSARPAQAQLISEIVALDKKIETLNS